MPFEGLNQEKMEEVTEAAKNDNNISTNNFSWNVNWDNGIHYKLGRLYPLWSIVYFNTKRTYTMLYGNDLDVTSYDKSRNMKTSEKGFYIRRARIYTAGYFFLFSPAFYTINLEIADGKFFIRDAFLWFDGIPILQTLKIGHFKSPSTLENMTSSRDRIFMETATPVEAFSQGTKWGAQISDSSKNQRSTWAFGLFRDNNVNDINDSSKNAYRIIGRGTFLAIDNKELNCIMHIGYSGSYIFSGTQTVQYRARPENYISARLVDTGEIAAKSGNINGIELAVIEGSFTFQSEFIHTSVNTTEEHLNFKGVYSTYSWFLTGESRPYRRDIGAFGQVIPKHSFSSHSGGWGAWEIAMRYSYLDLKDENIDGGRITSATAGLNWYMSRNVTMRFNAGYNDIKGGKTPGNVRIAQARLSINF